MPEDNFGLVHWIDMKTQRRNSDFFSPSFFIRFVLLGIKLKWQRQIFYFSFYRLTSKKKSNIVFKVLLFHSPTHFISKEIGLVNSFGYSICVWCEVMWCKCEGTYESSHLSSHHTCHISIHEIDPFHICNVAEILKTILLFWAHLNSVIPLLKYSQPMNTLCDSVRN